MKKEQLFIKNLGFSSIEVLLSVSLFALFLVVFSGIYIYSQESVILFGNRARAVYLAEEGLEAVRSIRDNNFSSLSSGTHGIIVSGGNWIFSGSSDNTDIFTRSIQINNINTNKKEVISTVVWQQNLQRSGSVSLVTRFSNWLRSVVSLSDWSNVSIVSTFNVAGNQNGYKIDYKGDYVYLIRDSGNPDFLIFNTINPITPNIVYSTNLVGNPRNIFVLGDYAYITNTDNLQEIQILDISNPFSVSVVSTIDLPGNADARGVFVEGNYLYVTRENSTQPEFYIIDITNPFSPSILGSLNLDGTAYEVLIYGNYAYVASDSNIQELQIINITNPNSPFLAGSYDLPSNDNSLTVSRLDNILYMGQGNNLRSLDITNPISPILLNTLAMSGSVNDISLTFANSFYAFVATSHNANEFKVIDITNPSSMSIFGNYNITGNNPLMGVVYDIDKDIVYGAGSSNTAQLIVFSGN